MYCDFPIYYNFPIYYIKFEAPSMEADLLEITQPQTTSGTKQLQTFHSLQDKNGLVFSFSCQNLPKVIAKKVAHLVAVLNSEVISIQKLKGCLAEGIPDEAALLREYSWKIILGYLPADKSKWEETVANQTKTYEGLVEMFLPPAKFQDYPLLIKKDQPRFDELQEDYLLWEQIEKDTSRTHAQFSFFASESQEMMIPYLTSARREKFKLIHGEDELSYREFLSSKDKQRKTYRYDYMTRILYIYARLNPKIQYVQGMNQILAPLFYLVNVNKHPNQVEEASCFYMFNNAISDIIELHIKDLDKSHNGIYGKLNEVNEMLVVIEPMIWSQLQRLKIDPFFYCFRWVTLLYAQDFDLFDTLRIWQSIFSADDRPKFTSFVAIAIIMSCKQVIVSEEFSVILEHLQNIRQNVNINKVIEIANGLYLQFKDKDFSEHAKKSKKALVRKQNEDKEKTKDWSGFFRKIGDIVQDYF